VSYRKVGVYMSIMAHQNSQLRVLEVGAGTGSSTAQILPYLVMHEGNGNGFVR
jgi:phospholipid N-methyltransferase